MADPQDDATADAGSVQRKAHEAAATDVVRVWPSVAALLLLVLALLVDLFGSFGISDRADTGAEYAAGILSGPFYGGGRRVGQDQIVIVLISEASMETLGENGWPVSYERMGQFVDSLATYQPRAVFLDFYFRRPQLDRRTGQPDRAGMSFLGRRLQAAERRGVRTLIGPVGKQADFAPLGKARQAGVAFEDSRDFAYPLRDVDGRPMAAIELYRLSSPSPPRNVDAVIEALKGRTLAVDWGFGTSAWMSSHTPREPDRWCRGAAPGERGISLMRLFRRFVAPTLEKDDGEPLYFACTYFDTIPAEWLSSESATIQADLARHLRGKIVLVGSDMGFLADRIPTPLLGRVPGVTVHAMMLDNLLEAGPGVSRYPGRGVLGWDKGDILELALVGLGILMIQTIRRRRGLPPNLALSLRDQAAVWAIIGGLALLIACLLWWPMFKLMGAVPVGFIALSVSENLRTIGTVRDRLPWGRSGR